MEKFSSKVLKPRYALVLSSNGFHLIFLQSHTFNSYICTLHENHYDMRRIVHVLAIAVIFLLSGCKKYDLMIEELNNRLDALQTGQIASLKQQIDAISISTKQMKDVNNELKEYLDALQATSAELNEKQLATNAKIKEIQTLLQGDITESRSDVLSQLESARKQIQTQIDFINSTITTLQSKDSELAQKIEVMNRRIDNLAEKSTSKEWIEETFVTLKQHEALSSDISIIKAQIESISKSISELEIRLNEKIARDIAEASESMSAEISSKISEITSAYTEAVKKAKEEIGHAYSEAIQTAISALETSLKSWVSEHLNGYYTIAEMDGKLSVLQNSISKDDGQLQTQIDALAKAIADGKSEITSAYTKAIEKAIMDNNGVIDSKIATEIAYTNGRIDSEIKRIEGLLNALEQRISVTENRIATLEEQIIGINNSIVLLEALNLELKVTIEGIIQGGSSSPVEIKLLQEKDEKLEKLIDELRKYVEYQLAETKDWAEGTFATIEQYSSIVTELSTIRTLINSTGEQYAEKINEAITECQNSITELINEKLQNYYTIAEIDGKLAALENTFTDEEEKLMAEINALKEYVTKIKADITEAYKQAIKDAIQANNGVINSKITSEISVINNRLNIEISKIEGRLSELEEKITHIENKITTLEEQITSINNSIALLEAVSQEIKNAIEGMIKDGNSSTAEIKNLQKKDAELEELIEGLRKYVDNQLAETKDWAEGTFATLEQYAAVMAELKTLKDIVDVNKTEIQELRKAITTCESSIKDWVCEKFQEYYTIAEIERKIAELQSIISEGDTNLQNQIDILAKAFAKLKIDSETTYIKAIEDAIQKNNGTIDSKIADAIEEANNSISNQIAALNAKIESLQAQVNKNAEEIAKLLKRIQSVTFIPSHSDGKATLNYSRSGNEFEASLTMRFLVSPKDAVSDLVHNLEVLTLKAVSTTTRTGLFINIPIISCRDEGEGVLLIEAATKDLDARIFEQSTETGISVALSISDGNTDITSDFVPVFVKETIKTTDYVITATYKTDTDNKEMWFWNTGYSICSKDNPPISIDYGDDSFGKEAKHTYEKAGEYTVKFYFEKPCTEISDYAFFSYPISGIHIPKETTTIGSLAFSNSPLESITFESNSNLTTIEQGAFNFCRKIKSIRLPESVTNIEECVFGGCSSLETVSGGGHGYTTISGIFCYEYFNYDFQCYMDKVLVFPAALNREIWDISFPKQEIGWGAFYGCEYLTKVTASILDIHQYNFIACNKLESINLAETIQIGNNVLNECPKLKEVSAPIASEIGPQCFCDNEALETITLDCNELKTIDQMGCNCINLHTIWIPAGVETISASFNGDAVLTDIYCKATTPPVLTESFNATTELTTIHVPIGSGDIYKNAEGWNNFAESIVEYDFNM